MYQFRSVLLVSVGSRPSIVEIGNIDNLFIIITSTIILEESRDEVVVDKATPSL